MRLPAIITAAAVALAIVPAAAAWTIEGGSTSRSFATTAGATAPFETLWRTRPSPKGVSGGLIEHGATTANGRLYVTTLRGETSALDVDDGRVIWTKLLGGGGTFATAPAFANGAVYVNARRPGRIWKLDARTGRVIWNRAYPGGNSEGGPAVVGRAVYVNVAVWGSSSGHLHRYSTTSGRLVWRRPLHCTVTNGPTWTGRLLVVADRCGDVQAFTTSGRTAWLRHLPYAPTGSHAPVTHAGGRLYVNTKAGLLFALSPTSGRLLWRRSTGSGVAYGPCAATRWRVYCGNGWDARRLSSWTRTGRRLWSVRTWGRQLGGVSLTGRTLWLSSFRGGQGIVTAYRPKTGRVIEHLPSGRYEPAIAIPGRVFVIHSRHVQAVS